MEHILNYQDELKTDDFYNSMTKRGFNINLNEKLILERCEGKIQKYGSKRKDILNSNNVDCHDFYYLLADKYSLNYISYKLILGSLDKQILKNLYRHIWIKWSELKDSAHKYIDDNDIEQESDIIIELIDAVINNRFKYKPEHIDEIYDNTKLLNKILDSFYRFSKKKKIYANFILYHFQHYFN